MSMKTEAREFYLTASQTALPCYLCGAKCQSLVVRRKLIAEKQRFTTPSATAHETETLMPLCNECAKRWCPETVAHTIVLHNAAHAGQTPGGELHFNDL
jgi:hypothetical protein